MNYPILHTVYKKQFLSGLIIIVEYITVYPSATSALLSRMNRKLKHKGEKS